MRPPDGLHVNQTAFDNASAIRVYQPGHVAFQRANVSGGNRRGRRLIGTFYFFAASVIRETAQDCSALSAGRRAVPTFVNLYSTLGGTSG